MSNTLHKLKIDLLKVTGARKFTAKDGSEHVAIPATSLYMAPKASYLDLDMRENRDGPDQYENTHMLTISPTAAQRAAKERTPIVGNAKTLTFGTSSAPSAAPQQAAQAQDDDEDNFIPF
jgi:hypothetical protein